jgi:hypothetical protein
MAVFWYLDWKDDYSFPPYPTTTWTKVEGKISGLILERKAKLNPTEIFILAQRESDVPRRVATWLDSPSRTIAGGKLPVKLTVLPYNSIGSHMTYSQQICREMNSRTNLVEKRPIMRDGDEVVKRQVRFTTLILVVSQFTLAVCRRIPSLKTPLVITWILYYYGVLRWIIPPLVFLSVVIIIKVHLKIRRERERLRRKAWEKKLASI